MKIRKHDGVYISEKIEWGRTIWTRARGLIGKNLDSDAAFILSPCNQIHTWFMKEEIDCVFLNKDNEIVYILSNCPPWRASKKIKNATCVVELPSGKVDEMNIQIGESLFIES
ncbi:DUF192 domain-containing protein [Salibacterium salarium]|uniref:DUF192 domain-containing protein n=1 Tax=Salibacterium salarium TaxID=284579 RepID=A0A3R9PHJ8_9BACI|nr:DUF192 domain-containing protein [Salibacterium salarium]RSL30823.1 DUF192 domain-containing protein [Salibacterium salarium]